MIDLTIKTNQPDKLYRAKQSASSTAKNCQGRKLSPSTDRSSVQALGITDSADFILKELISYTCEEGKRRTLTKNKQSDENSSESDKISVRMLLEAAEHDNVVAFILARL